MGTHCILRPAHGWLFLSHPHHGRCDLRQRHRRRISQRQRTLCRSPEQIASKKLEPIHGRHTGISRAASAILSPHHHRPLHQRTPIFWLALHLRHVHSRLLHVPLHTQLWPPSPRRLHRRCGLRLCTHISLLLACRALCKNDRHRPLSPHVLGTQPRHGHAAHHLLFNPRRHRRHRHLQPAPPNGLLCPLGTGPALSLQTLTGPVPYPK